MPRETEGPNSAWNVIENSSKKVHGGKRLTGHQMTAGALIEDDVIVRTIYYGKMMLLQVLNRSEYGWGVALNMPIRANSTYYLTNESQSQKIKSTELEYEERHRGGKGTDRRFFVGSKNQIVEKVSDHPEIVLPPSEIPAWFSGSTHPNPTE